MKIYFDGVYSSLTSAVCSELRELCASEFSAELTKTTLRKGVLIEPGPPKGDYENEQPHS